MKFESQGALRQMAARGFRVPPVSYVLGRFVAVRRGYGIFRGVRDRVVPPADGAGRPLFGPLDVDEAVDSLRRAAYFTLPRLPADVVAEVVEFATHADCRRQSRPPVFRVADVENGHLPGGEIAVLADVLGAVRNDAVRAVANEPSVIRAVSKYLGYVPTNRVARLIWSFVCDADDSVRQREGQTVAYHFDVQGYNFAYANYYLTDVDARSGAHTMIVGSHEDKPLEWLFGSANRSDAAIRAHYAPAREIVLEGPPGFGFIQDSSCYHRALAPIDRSRLMLQVRYF